MSVFITNYEIYACGHQEKTPGLIPDKILTLIDRDYHDRFGCNIYSSDSPIVFSILLRSHRYAPLCLFCRKYMIAMIIMSRQIGKMINSIESELGGDFGGDCVARFLVSFSVVVFSRCVVTGVVHALIRVIVPCVVPFASFSLLSSYLALL